MIKIKATVEYLVNVELLRKDLEDTVLLAITILNRLLSKKESDRVTKIAL